MGNGSNGINKESPPKRMAAIRIAVTADKATRDTCFRNGAFGAFIR